MKFNPEKCQVLHITNKRKTIQSSYYIHGQKLIIADTAKYLGVHLKNNLNWTDHIKTVTKNLWSQCILAEKHQTLPKEDEGTMLSDPRAPDLGVCLYSVGPSHQG